MFFELRDAAVAKLGAPERLARLRAETLEEIRLFELRHGEAIGQAEFAVRFDVTEGAISELEHSDDVRVSTTRPEPDAVSTVSARLAPTNADEHGGAGPDLSRTTDVQHDEHQRDPTSAYDTPARLTRNAQ